MCGSSVKPLEYGVGIKPVPYPEVARGVQQALCPGLEIDGLPLAFLTSFIGLHTNEHSCNGWPALSWAPLYCTATVLMRNVHAHIWCVNHGNFFEEESHRVLVQKKQRYILIPRTVILKPTRTLNI